MKRVYRLYIFLVFFSSTVQSQIKIPDYSEDIANLTEHVDKLSLQIGRLTDMIGTLANVFNETKMITTLENAASGLKSVGVALEETNHQIKTKITPDYMAQMMAVVAAGGTAMGIGVYVAYRLLTYKLFQNIEIPKGGPSPLERLPTETPTVVSGSS